MSAAYTKSSVNTDWQPFKSNNIHQDIMIRFRLTRLKTWPRGFLHSQQWAPVRASAGGRSGRWRGQSIRSQAELADSGWSSLLEASGERRTSETPAWRTKHRESLRLHPEDLHESTVILSYLVLEAELNREVAAVGHSLSAGHQGVNHHLGKRCQVCRLTEGHGDLSLVDWGMTHSKKIIFVMCCASLA